HHRLARTSPDFSIQVVALRRRFLQRDFRSSRFARFHQTNPPGQWCRQLPERDWQHLAVVLADCETHADDHRLVMDAIRYATVRAWTSFEHQQPGQQPQTMPVAAAHLAAQPTMPPAELAVACGISLDTLRRHCRRRTGQNLNAWCQQQRLEWVMARLSGTPSLPALAAAAGFSSYRQFQRCCKRWTGASARSLRHGRQNLAGSATATDAHCRCATLRKQRSIV
ncbi:MAG: helix-turn-helix domain-containing protein, partial [Planctomycetota bacterium]